MTEYINSPGNEVPNNTILVVPHRVDGLSYHEEIIESLVGQPKRDWFDDHFYHCLPLTIGNQYGFVVKSTRSFTAVWCGNEEGPVIEFSDGDDTKQIISNHFNFGVITVQNRFALKTPPGINLMTVQPPNYYTAGLTAMTAVIETDNIRRDFTFNLRMTIPEMKIHVKVGDPIAAFIPIARNTVEKYNVKLITDIFSKEQHLLETQESNALGEERQTRDTELNRGNGKRYFKGEHTNGQKYVCHQKKLNPSISLF
jgi:hypothetical protein